MHPFVKLAKDTIYEYVNKNKKISPVEPLSAEFKRRAGVFVSIKKRGELRGCIGTFMPTQNNVAMEIIDNAISASTRDPRFSPIITEELEELDISVDVLSEPEKVRDVAELDPKRYGVIVKSGRRRGLLLPDLEGVDTVDRQLSIAKRKADIFDDEGLEIMRFEVERYK